jgi:hypothetical protein
LCTVANVCEFYPSGLEGTQRDERWLEWRSEVVLWGYSGGGRGGSGVEGYRYYSSTNAKPRKNYIFYTLLYKLKLFI